jgi:hypothetical protein
LGKPEDDGGCGGGWCHKRGWRGPFALGAEVSCRLAEFDCREIFWAGRQRPSSSGLTRGSAGRGGIESDCQAQRLVFTHSGLPAISPTGGRSSRSRRVRPSLSSAAGDEVLGKQLWRLPSDLPTCGGDSRPGRGGRPRVLRSMCPRARTRRWILGSSPRMTEPVEIRVKENMPVPDALLEHFRRKRNLPKRSIFLFQLNSVRETGRQFRWNSLVFGWGLGTTLSLVILGFDPRIHRRVRRRNDEQVTAHFKSFSDPITTPAKDCKLESDGHIDSEAISAKSIAFVGQGERYSRSSISGWRCGRGY